MMQDMPWGLHAFLRGEVPHPQASITPNPGVMKELPVTWEPGGQVEKCEKARGKDGKF